MATGPDSMRDVASDARRWENHATTVRHDRRGNKASTMEEGRVVERTIGS